MISPEMIGVIVTGAGIIGHVFVANYRIQKNENEIDKVEKNLSDNISEIWKWKNKYEIDATERRFDIQKQIGSIEARTTVHDGNYQVILSMLSEIKQELKEIRNKNYGT